MTTKLFTLAVLSFLTAVAAFAQNPEPRFVHEPDLRKILPKFLTGQGFLDPRFAEATAKPSFFYSDFYGIQALQDTTRESIKKDFVPAHAEVAAEDENTLTLKFKNGWTGKFYPHASLKIMGIEVKRDHLEVSGDNWKDLLKNLEDFRTLLKANDLEKKYLIPNPYVKDEQTVAGLLASGKPPYVVPATTLEAFDKEKNAVLIYPEGVHGNVEGYEKFKANVLDRQKFDWIALEMLSPDQQKDLDIYIKAAEGSPEYKRARQVLLDYFKDAWNGRRGAKVPPEDLYYFKIVEQMRARKTRVIGIEKASAEYLFFRYGENKFGGAVRSLWWAQLLPKKGKGLVFGGSGHFTDTSPINFQDLLAVVNPKMKMFVLEPIKLRQPVK